MKDFRYLKELINGVNTSSDTGRYLNSNRVKFLERRPILSEYFRECIEKLYIYIDEKTPFHASDVYSFGAHTHWKYTQTMISAATTMLLLRGNIAVKREGIKNYFYSIDKYPIPSELNVPMDSIVVFSKIQ